jgi:hypothetical protein
MYQLRLLLKSLDLREIVPGQVTLHGGIYGWDRRNWTIEERTPTSVTYKHVDNANEGFPGTVTAYVRDISRLGIPVFEAHSTM